MFDLFFQIYVASVFVWMLHMFHIYVASVFSGCCVCVVMIFQVFHVFFASILDACFKCFICLQIYVASVYRDISKVDQVLHLTSHLGVSSSPSSPLHPCQTAEGARWRPMEGAWRGRELMVSPFITRA
jgi:hypothetical protein